MRDAIETEGRSTVSRPIAYVRLAARIIPIGMGIVTLVGSAHIYVEGRLGMTLCWALLAVIFFLGGLSFLPAGIAAISTDETSVTFVSQGIPWPSISIQRDQIERFSFCDSSDNQEVFIHIKDEHKTAITEASRKSKWVLRRKGWTYLDGGDPDALIYGACVNLYCCSNLKTGSEAIANDLNDWLHKTATP